MMTRIALLYFIILTTVCHISAQELLNMPTQNRCSFSGSEWEDEIYRFDAHPKIQVWVKEILDWGGETQNFEIIQASIENVAAIFDTAANKRYLLFSQNFVEKATGLEVYTALAHEIGHHANLHILTDARRKMEELEADQFMGYALMKSKTIDSYTKVQNVLGILPTSYPSVISLDERKDAVKSGWLRAEKLLNIKKSGNYENDPNAEAFLRAQFPFPPPPCCSPREIPRRAFATSKKLGDIATKISAVLEKQGYLYRNYLSVPNGFALVTQMEQYKADYSIRNDANRWANAPISESFIGFMDYFKRLIMPSKAHYRTFVFIVTTDAFNLKGNNITKNEAVGWYSHGINRLPKTVADMPYTEGVVVTALVYEFVVPESNRKPNQKCPNVNTQLHLEKSGIWQGL